jgi:tRNA(Ile)-lysidine synthase
MAMLAALCALGYKKRIFCLHIEHGLRPAEESCGDADFVRSFCKINKIKCRIKHITPGKVSSFAQRKGIGIEASARFFRHKALSLEAERLGLDKEIYILIAHTENDLLETALMRIFRGAGPAGLAVMPEQKGKILRPLLSISRAEVITYLNEKKITWCEDSTNADEKYLRNRIRCKLVPFLDESFPAWETGLFAMAKTQSLAADFIADEAQRRVKWESVCGELSNNKKKHSITQERKKSGKNTDVKFLSLCTDAKNFFEQPLIIREEALFLGINKLDVPASKKRIKSIKRLVVRQFCSQTVTTADLGSVRTRIENNKILLLLRHKEFFESGISVLIRKRRNFQ